MTGGKWVVRTPEEEKDLLRPIRREIKNLMVREMEKWEAEELEKINERQEVLVAQGKRTHMWGYIWVYYVEAPIEKDWVNFAHDRKRKSNELGQQAKRALNYWVGELRRGRVGYTLPLSVGRCCEFSSMQSDFSSHRLWQLHININL